MEIKLTQGKVALIDKEDFERVSKHSWCFDSSNGYPVSRIDYKRVRLHRFILNPKDNEFVDHINRNKLDNRKKNLRICNSFESIRNRGLSKNNTSGYKGVTKVGNKWRAQLSLNYKFIDLGMFLTAKEAAKFYNNKVKEIHKGYAYINKI
jgi:hypothetical protein